MRHNDDRRQHASVVGGGFGVGLVTLLAALGRQADDVARFAGRHVNDLGHGVFQQADDFGRITIHSGDDLLRSVDNAARPWMLECRMVEPPSVVTSTHATDAAGHRSDVLLHLAKEAGEEALELAIRRDKENE